MAEARSFLAVCEPPATPIIRKYRKEGRKMAKRYVAYSPFSLGRGRRFNPDHRQADGSFGYTEQQVDGLSNQQIRDHFDVVEVSGGQVEQATAAPGEKRSVSRVCDDCGFEAKSMAGLSVHRRSHE